jgi:hypothetical protein
MLDEMVLRLPTFDESTSAAVVLADGQAWWLAKPTMSAYYPRLVDGKYTISVGTDFGPDYDAMLDTLEDSHPDQEFFPAIFSLAADLLRRNYSIDEAGLSLILRFKFDDPASIEWVNAVRSVAQGSGASKPSAAG